jgi:hypothetical protein
VDVSSSDKTARLVETILIDPTCWPSPLYEPLEESVERTIRDYAHSILSDAEVHGMGRTVRHFTGRLDLWTPQLQTQIEDQLRPQIWAIVLDQLQRTTTKPTTTTTTSQQQTLIPISIRLLLSTTTTNGNSSTRDNTSTNTGILIQEDFLWDPSVPVSPLEFAQSMADDLQLPEEAAVDIATTIVEQIYGLNVPSGEESLISQPPSTNKEGDGSFSSPSITTIAAAGGGGGGGEVNSMGAWKMDPKEYVATTTQIVSSHRPL